MTDSPGTEQKHSPVHERHVELGAKFSGFGGWSMPLEYATGVVAEHTNVRTGAGIFDVSHLGTAEVRGDGAAAFVNSCLTNDLDRIGPGQAQYTLCCDETGGVIDDLVIYLYGPDRVLLIPNAANSAEVLRRLTAAAPAGVDVVDRHTEAAIFAVQGPSSDDVLGALGLPVDHDYMRFTQHHLDDVNAEVTVCRTGYTGERGYELIVDAEHAVALWDALMTAGEPWSLTPAGLGARDTLRTEMGYPLHGQELSLDTTPNQARSGWAVGWDKPQFWGREALIAEKQAGPRRRLCALASQSRAIPRAGMTVADAGGNQIGEITSGTFSPTLKQGIGLALLAGDVAVGDTVSVDVRGRPAEFVRVKLPFVETSVR